MTQQTQQQWQGTERRQSQGSYIGEERRKPKPVFEEPAQDPQNAQQARTPHGDDTH